MLVCSVPLSTYHGLWKNKNRNCLSNQSSRGGSIRYSNLDPQWLNVALLWLDVVLAVLEVGVVVCRSKLVTIVFFFLNCSLVKRPQIEVFFLLFFSFPFLWIKKKEIDSAKHPHISDIFIVRSEIVKIISKVSLKLKFWNSQ